jgi:hypothetical protein
MTARAQRGGWGQPTTLRASGAVGAGTNVNDGAAFTGGEGAMLGQSRQIILELIVTASTTPTSLDVAVQTSLDGGATWFTVVNFTRVGAVASSRELVKVFSDAAFATGIVPAADPAPGATLVVNNFAWGDRWRVQRTSVGTSYTYSVRAFLFN